MSDMRSWTLSWAIKDRAWRTLPQLDSVDPFFDSSHNLLEIDIGWAYELCNDQIPRIALWRKWRSWNFCLRAFDVLRGWGIVAWHVEIRVCPYILKVAVRFKSWPLDQLWVWIERCRSDSRRTTVEVLTEVRWFRVSPGAFDAFDGRLLSSCRSTASSSQLLRACHFGRPLYLWRSFASLGPSLKLLCLLTVDRLLSVGRQCLFPVVPFFFYLRSLGSSMSIVRWFKLLVVSFC